MGSQTSLTISIVMIVLFSIAIIGFSIGFANDTSADLSVGDDSDVSSVYTGGEDYMEQTKTDTEDTHQSILDTTVEPGSDVVPSAAPFAITIRGLTNSLKNIISLPVKYIFGGFGSPFGIFFTSLMFVVSFLSILYLIKTWKGNP
jgi:hypothetical protein